ncbi:response regulator [Caproiciproducens sp. NJN-50]|uniref:response regulator transcription factor n=1 Tax=Caproiciproducens sp. NJN-50 TaxID=2507162 RepID=UPI000FFE0D7D|nr:response regulator [Caproiciproducens sp. NJN-50]QAT48995.1 response regulator [Caproiciproducens sp. NJN-50]
MITILIADDEELIRKGLISILTKAIKTDVTYLEAENGLEALKICREQYPEIIVSDIRMPFCSGLKFIEKVKGFGYSPTFIIISGYSEFEYAKQAIKCGVKEYVLKPIQKKQFVRLIKSCIDEIMKKKAAMHDEFVNTRTNVKTIKAIRKKLLIDLLNCNDEKKIHDINNIETYEFSLDRGFSLCCVIQYKIDKGNLDYIDLAIINIIEEILGRENLLRNATIETYSNGQIVLVFEECNQETMLNSIVSAISKAFHLIEIYLKIDVFAGIGDIQFGSNRLYKSFCHACEAANCKLYQLGNSIQRYAKESSAEDDSLHFETTLLSPDDLDPVEIIHLFDPIIRRTPSIQSVNAVEKSYRNLMETVREQFGKYGAGADQDLPEPTPFCNYWSFIQMKHGMESYLTQVRALINKSSSDGPNNKLIQCMIQYIRDSAFDDINLNSVASHFSYTPAYISFLFKKQIGVGFNEFVTKTKMEMAKNMLKNTEIPIGEISRLCGYGNSKYFATSFKKSFGMSPSVFRQN